MFVEVVEVEESVKVKIFRTFITCFLQLLGSKHPDFVNNLIDQNCKLPIHRKIIKARYIDKIKFESIPDYIHFATSTRNIFKIHKQFIDNLVKYILSNNNNT